MSEETKQRLLQLVSDYGRRMQEAGYYYNSGELRAEEERLAQAIYDRIAAIVEKS